ncbi:putative proteasome-type protease [Natronospira proteinivora]|uniref:Proteasome-type protease n=1 Tax=Natronospira proteinivora TaxID=1807133 RepID=A0ABT1G8M3_9GAMM|nr:peptidase [Natronospira proteinivora]MCP1727671.1 putative proteasome-type protease [Natronospira proteinivora]
MTYCVAIRTETGLIVASDSRTSAGVDDVSVYSKMHVLPAGPDRCFVLLSAGNLATTQAVTSRIQRDRDDPDAETSIDRLSHLEDVAEYIGAVSTRVQRGPEGANQADFRPKASFILAGQIGEEDHNLFLIYPEGNYIRASEEKPFLQVGETKYGKPILDRIVEPEMSLEMAARCALVSLDASMRSNLSVGPPLELGFYHRNSFHLEPRLRYEDDDAFWRRMQDAWSRNLRQAFMDLPRFEWE